MFPIDRSLKSDRFAVNAKCRAFSMRVARSEAMRGIIDINDLRRQGQAARPGIKPYLDTKRGGPCERPNGMLLFKRGGA
jgi:hypothetical protein